MGQDREHAERNWAGLRGTGVREAGMKTAGMKRRRLGKLTAALFLFLTAGSFLSYAEGANQQDMEKAQNQVSALEEEKAKTEETLKNLEALKADTERYVRSLDASLNELSSQLTELSGQIDRKEEEISQANLDLEAAKERENSQYESMKLRIKYMYEAGDTEFLDLILESGSIDQMLNRAEYVNQIASYDRNMLEEYRQTKIQVQQQELKLESEHQELLALQEQTQAKENSVKDLMADKQAQLTSYNSQIASAQADIEQYQADIEAQEQLMRQIEEEMKRREEEERRKAQEAGQTYTVTDLGNISFKWPCPSSSRITSNFGDRESPTEGASSNHKGVDIGASTGSDILAAASGQVVIATYSYSAGNYIMIDHGGGVSSVYMHCSQLLVSKGEQVSQGQVIAKVGSTGYSTGPHLHFGIRSGGSYVNPLKYVSP